MHAQAHAEGEEEDGSVGRKNFRRFQHAKVELSHYFHLPLFSTIALLKNIGSNGLISDGRVVIS